VTGREIRVKGRSGDFDAYAADPAQGAGPGVILVSSIFGVDQDIKDMCDDLAAHGCVSSAPNFFWRDEDPGVLVVPNDVSRALARVGRIDFETSMDDVRDAIDELRQRPGCNGKIVLLGFCFGGPHAWRAPCDGVAVDATLSFHGTHVSHYMRPGDVPAVPVSLHYGDADDFAPPEELEAVRKVAEATAAELVIHPGAGHGFAVSGAAPSRAHASTAGQAP
jgi:carboxymethylenebutenolidase